MGLRWGLGWRWGSGVDACAEAVRAAAVELAVPGFADCLAEVVGSAAVVRLGESHHFVHEAFMVRRRVLELLGGLGFTQIGLELSPHDGARFDAYLASGDPTVLDGVGVFGARGTGDRDYAGLLAGVGRGYPVAGMRAESQRWLDALRATGMAWSVFGFDVEYRPGLAADRLARGVEEPERARLAQALEVSRRYDAAVRAARSYAELAEPMAWREELMARQVLARLADRPTARTVLIGHNLHVGAASDRIVLSAGIGPGGGRVPPMGTQLASAGVAGPCLWTLHDHGRDSGPPPGDGVIRSVPGSLNGALATLGQTPVALRTDADPCLARPWTIASMYATTARAVPAQACELILSAPVTSRLQDW